MKNLKFSAAKKCFCFLLLFVFVIGSTVYAIFFVEDRKKPNVCFDTDEYAACINDILSSNSKGISGVNIKIFPSDLAAKKAYDFVYAKVKYFSDTHVVCSVTVQYSDDDFEAEKNRIRSFGIDKYKGLYGVTGAPPEYEISAMSASPFFGFSYALVPKSGEKSVIYVAIIFYPYHSKLSLTEYLHDEILLPGLDVSPNNDFEQYMRRDVKDLFA